MNKTELHEKNSSTVEKCIENEDDTQYLYKYRELGEHTKDIIIFNRIFFSRPDDFNDPFDFNLPINLNKSTNELKEEDFIIFLNNLKRILKENNKDLEEISEETLIKIKSILKRKTESLAKELYENRFKLENIIQKKREESGICCFSKKCDNMLMWSHYAQDHKGICFKFDITEDYKFFSRFINVEYEEKVDTDITKYFIELNKFMKDSARIKYLIWSYEEEVRIVKEGFSYSDSEDRFVDFNPFSLKEIIFGCRTDQKVISEYQKLCEILKKNVTFSKMKPVENGRFELEKTNL